MVGFWKMPSGKGYLSHKNGLTDEQVQYLHNLKVGDKLVIFENEVRTGEKNAVLSLQRSKLGAFTEDKVNA